MRSGAFVFAACALCLPAGLTAQTYSRMAAAPTETVLRAAPTQDWRNYVTVPDGPCGYPMSVQADCYNGCGGCCGPLVLLHRVKRMLDCLLPCNMCCRCGCGGCGPMHGCMLGGRTWGHCSMCCGGPMGGCGRGLLGGGCCQNPCGSAFAPSYGGHCSGCGSVVPGASDSIMEDQTLPTPNAAPTPAPTPEVRRRPAYRTQPANFRAPSASTTGAKPLVVTASTVNSNESVLRRASAEQDQREPALLFLDYPQAKPIVRSQSPDTSRDNDIPRNPLRN